MAKLVYKEKELKIMQVGFDSQKTAKTESIFAQGNGYFGLRATDEEKTIYNKEDLFVNGIFNQADDMMVSELANTADLIQTPIFIDGIELRIDEIDNYEKSINLKTGLLTRVVTKKINKKKFKFIFKRFVSQKNIHQYGQEIVIKQLSGDPTNIVVKPGINGQTTNNGAQHFKEGSKKLINHNILQYFETTNESKREVSHALFVDAKVGEKRIPSGDDFVIKMERRKVYFDIRAEINSKKTFTLNKYMSVYTSIDLDVDVSKNDKHSLNDVKKMFKKGFDKCLEESINAWNKNVWNKFKIKIDYKNKSGAYDYLALVFAIYHLTGFVPTHDSRLGVGAKGLSGEGYQGHSYWDTEFFITPIYAMVNPSVARNLLEYRFKGLQGAKDKAIEFNAKGAAYPWEMAWPTDGEMTPYWGGVDIRTGKQVPIASRMQEQHVPADIAFAVDQYFKLTNDQSFMDEMGHIMIIETAIFWATRAEYNKKEDRYEYTDVMGPNEYKGNIDNNAYTNYMAKRNIDLALSYIKVLKDNKAWTSFKKTLTVSTIEEKLSEVSTKIYLPQPDEQGVISENDQFRKLPIFDLSEFQFRGDAGKKLFHTQEGIKRLSGQIVKQADVTLLTYILPEIFSKEVVKANYEYYEPKTTHDSSLSATTYAIQAIDLDKLNEAYKMYKYSLNIDMGPNFFSSSAGIHAGALGAIWQSTVYGFGGLRFYNNQLHINPKMPKNWNGLEYGIKYHGCDLLIKIDKKIMTITKKGSSTITIYHNEKPILLKGTTKVSI